MKARTTARKTRNAAVALLASLTSSAAFAAIPFAAGSTTLTADILTLVTPLAALGIIAIGVLCFFGKLSWGWLAAAIVGIVLVFGSEVMVTWIRGLFGV